MADGTTRISGYLDAADTRSTLDAVTALGAGATATPAGDGGLSVEIRGLGLRGAGSARIDVGNAGTLLRLLPGWLAGQPHGDWELDGDESIRRRPVDRIVGPLRAMGAEITARDDWLPPLSVRAAPLDGIDYELPIASAQVKSCLLLAGLLAGGQTVIREPDRSRDHTERMLAAAGAAIGRSGDAVTIKPCDRLEATEMTVPGDFSSAAYALIAALLVDGSEVELVGVGLNETRTGLLAVLAAMGVQVAGTHAGGRGSGGEDGAGSEVAIENLVDSGPEPFGSLHARTATLTGARIEPALVPLAIDELPLVGLLGCFAEGETVVSGAADLRHKESDRIVGVVEGLRGLGAEIEATADGFAVLGTKGIRGGRIDARGDHRLAMLGAVAGLASREGVEVAGFQACAVSYPGFEPDLRGLLA